MPDFLAFMLSGMVKSEYTIASTSSLTNPRTRSWDWDLIKLYGFPERIFPEIVEPGTILGNLLPDVAEKTGINENVPVIAGAGHDTAAAVASVPAKGDSDWAFLSSGTWSLIGCELDQPLINEQARLFNYTNEGGVERKIRFLKNIFGLWPVQACRKFWQTQDKAYSYSELTQMAEDNGPAHVWIDLNDWRFAKPGNMPEIITNFLMETNQQYHHSPEFLIRVILESLAFIYKEKIDELEKLTGKAIRRLHAVGGGIKNQLLTQFTADAVDREVLAGPVEGTIIGNIGVQAIATRQVSDLNEWRKIVANSFEVTTYQPKNPDYFVDNISKYKAIQVDNSK
jgi:sugar (pentulose or hexulose) kinase